MSDSAPRSMPINRKAIAALCIGIAPTIGVAFEETAI